jgi:hypothetical protein
MRSELDEDGENPAGEVGVEIERDLSSDIVVLEHTVEHIPTNKIYNYWFCKYSQRLFVGEIHVEIYEEKD